MEHKNTHIGRVFLVTAPSGAGKSSLVNALLKLEPAIKFRFLTRRVNRVQGKKMAVNTTS